MVFGDTNLRIAAPTLKSVKRMRNLRAALGEINRNAVGIDAIPYKAYVDPLPYSRLNPHFQDAYPELQPLRSIQESIAFGCIPDPVIPIRIASRTVESGTVGNRVRERAIARRLNSCFDRYFNDASYGYRQNRSPETAILRVRDAIRNGAHWAFKTDISGFFDNVSRDILERLLDEVISDKDLYNAILTAISPVVVRRGESFCRLNGLPQGNGITPFLSNLYLDPLDMSCSPLLYFRYADDLLVLGYSRGEVERARTQIRRSAAKLKLRLSNHKTWVCDLFRRPLIFLGYELRGCNIYPPEESIAKFQRKLELRGLEERKGLMRGFVRRYRIGPVRKLFRRLDRRFRRLYPAGLSLLSLLSGVPALRTDEVEAGSTSAVGVQQQRLRASNGQNCGSPCEKTFGRPPHTAQLGVVPPSWAATPSPMETDRRET